MSFFESNKVLKLRIQERCIIKSFSRLSNQERYEHVGPEVTSLRDGKVYKMAKQDYAWLIISRCSRLHSSQDKGTSSHQKSMITTSNHKLMIEVNDLPAHRAGSKKASIEICAFSQHENESLIDAWLRMKEMLRNCHGHNLSKEFDIEIKDRKGTENVAADHLSRIENDESSDDSDVDDNFPGETLMEYEIKRPFLKSHKFEYILVAVDYVSKWAEAQALQNDDARVGIPSLRKYFAVSKWPKL
ncbi:reverse transcriptase domain-containing protein [Tanacetum coccineum]